MKAKNLIYSVFVTLFLLNQSLLSAVFIAPGYYSFFPSKFVLSGQPDSTYIKGEYKLSWAKVSGPGEVNIERPDSAITWCSVTLPGKYEFKIVVTGKQTSEARVKVNVLKSDNKIGNPILPGMFPDPHILFDNGKFYIYATSMENSKGEYGRASVWISEDFVNWNMKLTNWPVYGSFGGDIWAPDIIKKDNKYYQFITKSGSYDTWVAVADYPEGPWKNLRENNTAIVSGGGNAGKIVKAYNMDAQPFIDDDGQAYMYWGWSESMAAKLTSDLKNIDGDVHFLKGTKWVANGGTHPQWLIVDLDSISKITRFTLNPEFSHVSYDYSIEVSDDKQSWKRLVYKVNNSAVAGSGYIDFVSSTGRYVKLTFINSDGNWAGAYDFSVFNGDKKLSLNKPVTASSSRGEGSEAFKAVDVSNGPNIDDFVEGSYMIKRNGKYYLLYSSGALHDGSYSVHYAIGDSPFGPFKKPNPNIVIRKNAENTTRGPGHNSILKFNDKYYIVYHQHNQPHEDGALVFRQTCADLMEFNANGTIKEVIPTQTGIGALLPAADKGFNVALGKYAVSGSYKTASYAPEFAFDNNNASKWVAKTNKYPQYLTVDLKSISEIERIETSFEYPTLSYKYKIETSVDGKKWDIFADKSSVYPKVVSPQVDYKNASAKFVRMTIYGCQRPENSAGIYELKVFGKDVTSLKKKLK